MKRKLLLGFGALVIVLIIVAAVILCLNTFNKEKRENSNIAVVKENDEVNVQEKEDIKPVEKGPIEIISSDILKKEYNEKICSMYLDVLIGVKGEYDSISGSGISKFNSGKFSDQEKLSLLFMAIDFTKQEHLDGPLYLVDMQAIQEASLKLFEEKVDISNLKNVTITDGKIKLGGPTGRAAHLFKAKSLMYDEKSKIYTLVFDYLKYTTENAQYTVTDYSKDDIYATFELKYKENENGKVFLEMNKI